MMTRVSATAEWQGFNGVRESLLQDGPAAAGSRSGSPTSFERAGLDRAGVARADSTRDHAYATRRALDMMCD